MSCLLTISCRSVEAMRVTTRYGGGGGTPAAGYYVLTTKTISKQQCQIIVHLNAKCLITVTKVTAATTYDYSLVYKLFL